MRSWGLLEYAASINMVVMFPQSNDTREYLDAIHKYCWVGASAYTRDHPQIRSLVTLMNSVTARNLFPQDEDPEHPSIFKDGLKNYALVIAIIISATCVISLVVLYSVKLCQLCKKRLEVEEDAPVTKPQKRI